MLSYFMASLACSAGAIPLWESRLVLTAAAILVTGGAAVASQSLGRGVSREGADSVLHHTSSTVAYAEVARAADEHRFLGNVALALSGIFLFAVVLAGAANLFIASCA